MMKGYAIAMIALHNFLHLERFGFVPQNENSFLVERSNIFFEHFQDFSWSFIGDFFSFIGWIGVPVFVFLSGYGLEKKYSGKEKMQFVPYIRHSWLKLFLLMLPAVLCFLLCKYLFGWGYALRCVFSLTLLNNFVCNVIPFNPGVYWYFGLTFQFYVVYYFIHNLPKNGGKQLAYTLGIVCLAVLMVFNPSWFPNQEAFELIRHNFVGWMPWFAMGIICAKENVGLCDKKPARSAICLLLSIMFLVVALLMNLNFYVWLFLPFVAIAFFYCFSRAAENWKPTKWLGNWLGRYSSFIFVVHPIARNIVLELPFNMTLSAQIVLYIVLFVVGAMLYKPLYLKLMTLFHC